MSLIKILKSLHNKFSGESPADVLARILSEPINKEEFLGIKKVTYPTPESVRRDAAKIARYSETEDYKRWADEAWGRIISALDQILDADITHDKRQYYCGVVRASLDLLRVSYTAKDIVINHPDANAPLRPKQQGE